MFLNDASLLFRFHRPVFHVRINLPIIILNAIIIIDNVNVYYIYIYIANIKIHSAIDLLYEL